METPSITMVPDSRLSVLNKEYKFVELKGMKLLQHIRYIRLSLRLHTSTYVHISD